ncbi:MAG: molybdopterin-dependent oxidoreductase [Sarcina sp.]
MEKFSSGCTLDCADCCSFNVYKKGEEIIKVQAKKNHPYTKGFLCKKGIKHIELLNHRDRFYSPLLKINGEFKEISFQEALKIMAEKLSYYKENYGSNSVLYYEQYGSGSLLKSIGDIFCNFYGGVLKTKGGPCWSAGMKAQKYDFGDAKSHSLEDMLKSKSIILWGKNPAYTAIHTASYIKKAKDKGIEIIVIDPIYTETAKKFATKYIRVNPSMDGALAFAMHKIIIDRKLYDKDYIDSYVEGFEEFKDYINSLDLSNLLKLSGVSLENLEFLVEKYTEKYSSIHIGYGVQKYKNGGNTVRAIDALAAITGQIGFSGGGVNYANKVYPKVLNTDPYKSFKFGKNKEIMVTDLANYLLKGEKPIKMALIYKSNLLNQLANINKLKKAFDNVEFKVCSELFLTDTAKECDLIIPATNVFESEDLLYSSMNNPYLIYKEEVVKPREKLMDEYYFFMELAEIMGMKNYPKVSKKEYLERVIEPLKEYKKDLSLDSLKEGPFTIHEEISWENKVFDTKSKKFSLYSEKAKKDGLSAIPILEIYNSYDEKYPIRLITTHHRDSLSSVHFMDDEKITKAYINEETAKKYNVENGKVVTIKSKNGEIAVKINIENSLALDVMKIYAGHWAKQGNANFLTNDEASDMGGQIVYNESFVSFYN